MLWREKKVLLVGFGRSGQASARFLLSRGAKLLVNDISEPSSELRQTFASPQLTWEIGHHDAEKLIHDDLAALVLSPGVDPRLPLVIEAQENNIPVFGDLELALQEITSPVVAITGTNGKSTVTSLIGHLLQTAGKKVCVAGNIGLPLLDVLSEAQNSEFVVLELSSFQLEQTPSLNVKVAVWLNATEDHLDRYENFAAYVDAKAQIFRQLSPDGVAIYNADDAEVVRAVLQLHLSQDTMTFSLQSPQKLVLQDLPLVGLHNQQNMMASLLAVQACGVHDETVLLQGLQTFQNLKHRLELVAEKNGVRYYDDSKGTNVGATVGALSGFKEPVILIAGGKDKGGSYLPLVQAAQKNVKTVVLLGEAAPLLEEAFAGKVATARAASMSHAVQLASQLAQPGDVVLLSPACSSFDMFRNYAERGEVFRQAVANLVQHEGA